MRMLATVVAVLFLLLNPSVVWSENWPQWRGPNQDGVAPGKGYPVHWSEKQNIAWKVSVPGWGTSTPIVWNERIMLTCTNEQKNALLCLNREGQQLWQVSLGPAVENRNSKASSANPSPVTDGERVYAYYKSGELACVDLSGQVLWQMNLQSKFGRDQLWWDLGTSPVLTKDHVVVAVMHQGPSYLVAFDKRTGKESWKRSRDLDAPGEARDAYTTPLVVTQDGRELLIVLGADHVTAHDATSGEIVWQVGGLNPGRRGNFRSIASPAVAGELLIAPYSRGATLTAIRLGGKGDVTQTHIAWTLDIAPADVPTPVVFEHRIYVCSDRGDVTCLDFDGKPRWVEQLPRNRYVFSSSPVAADGKLFLTREDGTTFVLQLGDRPQLVATNALLENTYATPVFVDNSVLVRTSDYLFCIR